MHTETTDIDTMRAGLVGISLSAEPGRAVYIPVGHTDLGGRAAGQMDLATVRRVLGPLLTDDAVPKCGHHLKFDLKVLRRHGLDLRGIAFDTLLASHCLNPDRRSHGLKELSLERLNVRQTPIEDLIGTKGAYILDQKLSILGKVPIPELTTTLKSLSSGVYAIVLDGTIDRDLVAAAERSGAKFLIGTDARARGTRTFVMSADALEK